MWTTRDGYGLRLPAGVTLPVSRAAVMNRLAPAATLTTLLDRSRGLPRAVLTGRIGLRPVTMVARMAGPDELVLEALRSGAPDAIGEFEAIRALNVKLAWVSVRLSRAPSLGYPGVYVLERRGLPIYVGQSMHVGRRWTGRMLVLQQIRCDECAGSDTLWVGRPEDAPGGAALAAFLRGAEHVVVRVITRWLSNAGKEPLSNRSSFREFLVGPGGVSLRNSGTKPAYVHDITLAAGTRYEVSAAAAGWR